MVDADHDGRGERRKLDWRAAILAGVIAGVGFAALEMTLNTLLLEGPVARQIRMVAAVILGEEVLSPAADFDWRILLAALAVHLTLSILYAIVLAWIILRLSVGIAEVVGLVFGLLLFLLNFYGLVAYFPWFREGRDWISVVTHLAFGLMAALEYKAFTRTEA